MSVLAVPQSKSEKGYRGKHTHGIDDTYLHFLNIAYTMHIIVKAVRTMVMNICIVSNCLSSCVKISSQLVSMVRGRKVKGCMVRISGIVNALTPHFGGAVGLMNLYSSMTTELKIILSIIFVLKIQMINSISIAIMPNRAETNSIFCQKSTYFMKYLNSFCAHK